MLYFSLTKNKKFTINRFLFEFYITPMPYRAQQHMKAVSHSLLADY